MLINFIGILFIIHVFFYLAIKRHQFAVMDVCWGLGSTMVAYLAFFQHIFTWPKFVLLMMVSIWGIRLSYHIGSRLLVHGEDFRYAKLKQEWGADYIRQGYLKVFLLQGLLMFIVTLPVQVGMSGLWDNFGLKQVLGFAVWISGFLIESWADTHLKKYKLNPLNAGKLCTSGPWRICRYPNFLGELMMWWGIYIYIFSFWSSWTFIGPLTLTFFMIKVSGIPMLEERFQLRPGYKEYAQKVPRLFPLPLSRIKNLFAK